MRAQALLLAPALLFAACAEPSSECEHTARQSLRAALRATPATVTQALTVADVRLDGVGPNVLLPGSVIRIAGVHLGGETGEGSEVWIEGSFQPAQAPTANNLSLRLPAVVTGGGSGLEVVMTPELIGQFGTSAGRFDGLLVVRPKVGVPPETAEVSTAWSFQLAAQLDPDLFGFNLGEFDVFPADRVVVDGEGFLLGGIAGEGITEILVTGEQRPADGSPPVLVNASAILEASPDRASATFLLLSDILDPRPGDFEGGVSVINRSAAGDRAGPGVLPISLRMNPPFISGFAPMDPTLGRPNEASRGQIVRVEGRGFLPVDAEREEQTILRLDGQFQPSVTRGIPPPPTDLPPGGLLLVPDTWIDNSTVTVVLRSEFRDGALVGFSARPGRFEGTVTPILFYRGNEESGLSWPDGFAIAPTRQAIWVKYLPTFRDTLEELFGLRAVDHRIRTRVDEVLRRDFGDFNVDIRDRAPEDFAEYSIVEIGGPDPNGRNLFGLDNTEGKDTGNTRLNDVIGGSNAACQISGYPCFGGIFLDSFIGFSPNAAEPLSVASAEFDRTIGRFAPFLCRPPLSSTQLESAAAADDIDESVRVMGNLVGGTVVHEIGHSLGLTQAVVGETSFHNIGDNAYIMDVGTERSFPERAELLPDSPSVWHPENARYLGDILRKPAEDGE